MINYKCVTQDNRYAAVITDGDEVVSIRECPSKFEAMELRDKARNARVWDFDHIDNPPPVVRPGAPAAPEELPAMPMKGKGKGKGKPPVVEEEGDAP
jgi:hypothetical protein